MYQYNISEVKTGKDSFGVREGREGKNLRCAIIMFCIAEEFSGSGNDLKMS
jgi:hypothetical protein